MKSEKDLLAELLSERGLTRKSRDLDQLGAYLGFLVGRQSAYPHRYMTSILNGTLKPGRKLIGAILEALAVEVDGGVQATHMAQPKVCSEINCTNRFVSNHPTRIRCYLCSPVRNRRGD